MGIIAEKNEYRHYGHLEPEFIEDLNEEKLCNLLSEDTHEGEGFFLKDQQELIYLVIDLSFLVEQFLWKEVSRQIYKFKTLY